MTDPILHRFNDGQPVPVGAVTRAELLGQGLFETMRWNGRQIPLLSYHIDRLRRGAQWLGYQPEAAESALTSQLSHLAGEFPAGQHALVRFQLSHQQNERGYASCPGPLVTLWQCSPLNTDLVTDIAELTLLPGAMPPNAGPPVKHTSRVDQVVAAQHPAARVGVRCDAEGFLREGLSSNLFMLRHGHVLTPVLTHHGVSGTLSAWVQDQCGALGFPLLLGDFPPAVLAECEAVWLSSAVGLQAVASGAETHFDTRQHPVFVQLETALRQKFA